MVHLAQHNKCTGCKACMATCKFGAITFKKDRLGFAYPLINKKKCNECGLCNIVCPALNITNIDKTKAKTCYAAIVQNKSLTIGCTSGGIATACAKKTIDNGGCVYGASWVPGFGVRHIRIDNINDIDKLKGSKYVESDISDVYQSIRTDLKKKVNILFIGTPCQVSAVRRVFKKEESVITISFICGGVPSSLYLESFFKENKVNIRSVENVIFRKGINYCIEALSDGKSLYSKDRFSNPYSIAFDEGYSLRPACLNCDYCSRQRVGDLTIGDFWGADKTNCTISHYSSLSCVLVHSVQGERLINAIDDLLSEEVTVDDIAKNNHRLNSVRTGEGLQLKTKTFQALFPLFGFSKSVSCTKIFFRIQRKIKKCLFRILKG